METDKITNSQVRSRQRLLAGAIFAGLVMFAVGAVVVTEKPKNDRKPSETTLFSIRPEYADRETLIARYDAKILALSRDIAAIRSEAEEREKKLNATIILQEKALNTQSKSLAGIESVAKRLGYMPRDNETPEEAEARIKALEEQQSQYLANLKEHFGSGVPGPVYTDRPREDILSRSLLDAALLPDYPDNNGAPAFAKADLTSGAPSATGQHNRLSMVQLETSSGKKDSPRHIERKSTQVRRDEALSLNRVPGSTVTDYIPAGAFVQGRVLTGLYAATGAGASSAALPMLILLENTAILPNTWKTNVKHCHLTASATGDLSSERVFVRLDRLSCIGKTGEVLDVQVKGYLVGSDGKVGLRGKLVTRSGQAIASAISVGLLSGFGNAISRSNEEIETSVIGTQTKRYTNAWLSGMGEGMTDAMDRITDYYLKLADRIFPVLEIEAGRRVEAVFSQGVLLTDEVD